MSVVIAHDLDRIAAEIWRIADQPEPLVGDRVRLALCSTRLFELSDRVAELGARAPAARQCEAGRWSLRRALRRLFRRRVAV